MPPMHDVRREFGSIPARLVWAGADASAAGRRGALLFTHGFGVGIDIQTAELHSIANAGYLAVGFDAVGHGARRWPDFDERFAGGALANPEQLFGAVRDTAAEVPAFVDALIDEELATPERIGMAGISMGGFATYRARVVEPRLSLLMPILASPVWTAHVDESPQHFQERFFPAALLSQTAALDESVPANQAADFAKALVPLYGAAPDRLRHVEHAGESHFMSEAAWGELWANVLEWLALHWPTSP